MGLFQENSQETDPYIDFKKEHKDFLIQEADMVIRGSFEFFHGENLYSEENFAVYKVRKDGSIVFIAEQMTRFVSGEVMKLRLTYQLSKEWIPTLVLLEKFISDLHVIEKYHIPQKSSLLEYEFWSKHHQTHYTASLPVPPRFQVASSCISTTCLFLGSKKFDPTGRNYYSILSGDNNWECKALPVMKYVVAERMSTSSTEVKVKGKSLKSTHFRVRAFTENSKIFQVPINTFISKHYFIPYLVEVPDDIKIQIKALQELEVDDND